MFLRLPVKFPTKSKVQANLYQKLLFLHQLIYNNATDCSLNNTWKFQAQNMGRTCCEQKLILTFRTIYVHNMFSTCSAKIRASDKDLPVIKRQLIFLIWEEIRFFIGNCIDKDFLKQKLHLTKHVLGWPCVRQINVASATHLHHTYSL